MFYSNTIQETRQIFFNSWTKYKNKRTLSALEQEIVQVLLAHPEYHKIVEDAKFLDHSYYPEFGETNPFLHMGLHLAIREQAATNRPTGINLVYTDLLKKYKDSLTVEHLMMEQLAECLWLAQKNQTQPDEIDYLNKLKLL